MASTKHTVEGEEGEAQLYQQLAQIIQKKRKIIKQFEKRLYICKLKTNRYNEAIENYKSYKSKRIEVIDCRLLQKINEQLKHAQNIDGAKKTTRHTDPTTLITREADERVIETTDLTKDIQEFVYRQKSQAPPHHDRVESNLMMSSAEHLIENESRIFSNITKSNLLVTSSQMPEILDEKHHHHEHHYQHGTTLLDFCQLQPTQNIDVSFTATNTNSNTTRPHLKDDYNYGNDSCETDMNNRSYIEDNILVVPRKSLSADDSRLLTIKNYEKVQAAKRKSFSVEPDLPPELSVQNVSNNSIIEAELIPPQKPFSKRRKLVPVESKRKTQNSTTKSRSSNSSISDETKPKKNPSNKLQNVACFEISQSMGANYCRECSTSKQPLHRNDCRFVGWRLLNESHCGDKKNNFLSEKDVTEDDKKLWMPQDNFNLFTSKSSKLSDLNKFVRIAGDIREPFKKIWSEELDAMRRVKDESNKHKICWKQLLAQTRETCDQCQTHIFNVHFACRNCGFSVCLSCYDDRERKNKSIGTKEKKEVDNKGWLFCQTQNAGEKSFANKKSVTHELNELMICYFIPLEAEEIQRSHQINQIETFDTSRFTTKLGSDDAKFLLIDSKPKLGDTQAQEENELNIFKIFDIEWQRGDSGKRAPIVIKNVDKRMTSGLWSSEWFKKKFSGQDDINVDLINCENGREIQSVPISYFWSGFDKVGDKVLLDRVTKKVFNILKLKDWPPAKDFKVVLQDQYYDLMDNLPVKEYCNRDGTLNLAANVPEHFLKPDLGPKLYIAYSSADAPKAGTTNLHIDISDAFNVIMHVGESTEIDEEKFRKIIRYSGISEDQIKRYTEGKERPGAIWHLFKPDDADKIRTFLFEKESSKISKNAHNLDKITSGDFIHDQRFYLDAERLVELKVDYNVTPYTILQFVGDAIFIPAGAPHQVRNVKSCIKVADDFVTSQNIDRCMRTANELRRLTEKHTNREDKLQDDFDPSKSILRNKV